jgi:hypothetical protein
MELCTTRLNAAGLPFRVKVLDDPATSSRRRSSRPTRPGWRSPTTAWSSCEAIWRARARPPRRRTSARVPRGTPAWRGAPRSHGRRLRRVVDQRRPRRRDPANPARGDQGGRRRGPAPDLPRLCPAMERRCDCRSIHHSRGRAARLLADHRARRLPRHEHHRYSPRPEGPAVRPGPQQPHLVADRKPRGPGDDLRPLGESPHSGRLAQAGAGPGRVASRGVRSAGGRGARVHRQRVPGLRLRYSQLLRARGRGLGPLQLHGGDHLPATSWGAGTWRGASRRPTSGGPGTGSTDHGRSSAGSDASRIRRSPSGSRSTPSRSTPSSTRAPHQTTRR